MTSTVRCGRKSSRNKELKSDRKSSLYRRTWPVWGVLFYANNESKSALAREPGDCSDNKWKLAKLVFACLENFLFNKEALHV